MKNVLIKGVAIFLLLTFFNTILDIVVWVAIIQLGIFIYEKVTNSQNNTSKTYCRPLFSLIKFVVGFFTHNWEEKKDEA